MDVVVGGGVVGGVAEHLLEDLAELASLDPQRGEGVPEVVEADLLWRPGLLQDGLEVPLGQVAPGHVAAQGVREDEPEERVDALTELALRQAKTAYEEDYLHTHGRRPLPPPRVG